MPRKTNWKPEPLAVASGFDYTRLCTPSQTTDDPTAEIYGEHAEQYANLFAAAPDLLREALDYKREQFDGDPETDLSVSGADLVDWFCTWREKVRAALGEK